MTFNVILVPYILHVPVLRVSYVTSRDACKQGRQLPTAAAVSIQMNWHDAVAPQFGPHDGDLSTMEWYEKTLKLAAEDDEEREQFEQIIRSLRTKYKAKDVASLKELTKLQVEQAAATIVGDCGKRGVTHLVMKYLGTQGHPHQPPSELDDDAEGIQMRQEAAEATVKFGRIGKTGRDSAESNFPEAMRPSSRNKFKVAEDIHFPEGLRTWLSDRCSVYSKMHPMGQDVTLEVSRVVGDWIISLFGTSPVSFMPAHFEAKQPVMSARQLAYYTIHDTMSVCYGHMVGNRNTRWILEQDRHVVE